MGDFIEAKDPRGLKIYCTKAQWENHIVADLTGHPIMKENIPAILETLQNPDFTRESNDSNPPFDYREVYVKEVEFATYHSKSPFTKVVVSILGGSGEIVTAYNSGNQTGGMKGDDIYVPDEDR